MKRNFTVVCLALAAAAIAMGGCSTRQPVLTTQQFERNEVSFGNVDSARLERFGQDLHARKDYDYSQHDRQAGPDHAYLVEWAERVAAELVRRGYVTHPEPILYRPDGSAVDRR